VVAKKKLSTKKKNKAAAKGSKRSAKRPKRGSKKPSSRVHRRKHASRPQESSPGVERGGPREDWRETEDAPSEEAGPREDWPGTEDPE